MTNAMIIFNNSVEFMEQGIIGTTGRTVVVEDQNGNKKELKEPEAIHTYAKWKELGYQVQKGQKAIASFCIWKHTVKEASDETKEDESKMFMKKASFFKFSQVEKNEIILKLTQRLYGEKRK